MKANAGQIAAALDRADPAIRLFLLYGPDMSGSRALAERLERALGSGVERVDLDGATLKGDPARLSDEASAISLFGDRRYVRVTGGEECLAAIEALLDSSVSTDPVVMLADVLRGTSSLLKRVLAHPAALAFASYKPEGANAEAAVVAAARTLGLRIAPREAAAVAAATGADRAVIARELEKFALFLDAAPDRPRELTSEVVDALGADAGESDTRRLVEAVFDGAEQDAVSELARFDEADAIPLLRAANRRLMILAKLRSAVDGGKSPVAALAADGKSLNFKEKDLVARQLARWPAPRLAVVAGRLFAVEESIKRAGAPGALAAAELLAITRVAARLR